MFLWAILAVGVGYTLGDMLWGDDDDTPAASNDASTGDQCEVGQPPVSAPPDLVQDPVPSVEDEPPIEDEPAPPVEDIVPGLDIVITNGADLQGTDGDDTYRAVADYTQPVEGTIAAGAGDDLIDFDITTAPERFPGWIEPFSGDILGQAGNDTISIEGSAPYGALLSGGDGDDVIDVGFVTGSTISGGDGDDSIAYTTSAADFSIIEGDAGNDTIDARSSTRTVIDGGAGDDLILTEYDSYMLSDTGDRVIAAGGDGDDTLQHEVDLRDLPWYETYEYEEGKFDYNKYAQLPTNLAGGEGNDTFLIELEGDPATELRFDDEALEADPRPLENTAARLGDFVRGEDVLIIDVGNQAEPYGIAETVTMTEDRSAGETLIEVFFSGDGEVPDLKVVIEVAATGLTFDDIEIIGGTPALQMGASAA